MPAAEDAAWRSFIKKTAGGLIDSGRAKSAAPGKAGERRDVLREALPFGLSSMPRRYRIKPRQKQASRDRRLLPESFVRVAFRSVLASVLVGGNIRERFPGFSRGLTPRHGH